MRILQQETRVRVEISPQWPLNSAVAYVFSWDCQREDFAALLAQNLSDSVERRLSPIRELAYERGWKEAKAKQRKRISFAVSWIPEHV